MRAAERPEMDESSGFVHEKLGLDLVSCIRILIESVWAKPYKALFAKIAPLISVRPAILV